MTEKLVEKAMKRIFGIERDNSDVLITYTMVENILSDLYYGAFKAGQETRSKSDYDDGHLDGFKDGYAQATEDETA